jgi:hypothetical protein
MTSLGIGIVVKAIAKDVKQSAELMQRMIRWYVVLIPLIDRRTMEIIVIEDRKDMDPVTIAMIIPALVKWKDDSTPVSSDIMLVLKLKKYLISNFNVIDIWSYSMVLFRSSFACLWLKFDCSAISIVRLSIRSCFSFHSKSNGIQHTSYMRYVRYDNNWPDIFPIMPPLCMAWVGTILVRSL